MHKDLLKEDLNKMFTFQTNELKVATKIFKNRISTELELGLMN